LSLLCQELEHDPNSLLSGVRSSCSFLEMVVATDVCISMHSTVPPSRIDSAFGDPAMPPVRLLCPRSTSPRCQGAGTALLLCLSFVHASASADEEQIEFQRPESWAMAYVATAFIPAIPPGAASDAAAGSLAVGADALYLRRLNTRDEQVGFDGTAPEGMNRSPVLGTLRFEAGLPAGVQASVTWVPPVDIRGVRADVATLSLARGLLESGHVRLSGRIFAAEGRVSGDITSDRDTANAPGGSPGNPLDTDGESHDLLNLRMAGVDLLAWERLDDAGTSLFAGIEGTLMHLTFHVRSQEGGVVDRSVLATQGGTWAGMLGASGRLSQDLLLGGSLYYSPLRIDRPQAQRATEPFVTVRASLTVLLR
jgi:hypothetical protein